jgi:deoxyribonuclease-4
MRKLDRVLGIKLVKAVHLNDSKRELGSRVDRHEHIGKGQIGLEGFRLLLNDRRFDTTPMYLETPKEENGEPKGLELDRMNLELLRSMIDT